MPTTPIGSITHKDCFPDTNKYPVPSSAFLDPTRPTEAEVLAFVTATYPLVFDLSLFYYQGTSSDPIYVWRNSNGNTLITRIEGPIKALISDSFSIPAGAFADPALPTTTEATAYVVANYTTAEDGSVYSYVSCNNYAYVWRSTDNNTTLTAIEDTPKPRAIIDIEDIGPPVIARGNASIPGEGATSIVEYRWKNLNYNYSGNTLVGAPGVAYPIGTFSAWLQSGGTYDKPIFRPDFGDTGSTNLSCDPPYTIGLQVVDDCGNVSEWVEQDVWPNNYCVMTVTHYRPAGSPLTLTIPLTAGETLNAWWEMGDGVILYGVNTVNYTYALEGTYVTRIHLCTDGPSEIRWDGDNLTGTIEEIWGDCGFDNSTTRWHRTNSMRLDNTPWYKWPYVRIWRLESAGCGDIITTRINLFEMPNLQSFYFSSCCYEADMPYMEGHPTLKLLWLQANVNMTGDFPDLNTLPVFEDLNITSTSVVGGPPESLDSTTIKSIVASYVLGNGESFSISNLPALTYLNISYSNYAGSFPNLSTSPLLSYVNFNGNSFSAGPAPNLTLNPVLTRCYLNSCNLTTLPNLTGCPLLIDIWLSGNTAPYVPGSMGVSNTALKSIMYETCGLTSTDVDNIICDVAASGSLTNAGTLSVRYNSAPPTAVGLACKATLQANGWTVLHD